MTFTQLPVPQVITVYGATWCGACIRLKAQLDRLQVAYDNVDVDENPQVLPALTAANGGSWLVPTVALPDGRVLVNPPASALVNQPTSALAGSAAEPGADAPTAAPIDSSGPADTEPSAGPDAPTVTT